MILPFPLLATAGTPPAPLNFAEILWRAYATSDTLGKAIILVLLLFSIYAWIIICNRVLPMISRKRECDHFLQTFGRVQNPLAIGLSLPNLTGPLKNVCQAGIQELGEVLGIQPAAQNALLRSGRLPRKLSVSELDKIRASMNHQVNLENLELENGLAALSVFVTVSPFLGLFGTVWGVMATFMAIAQSGSAELTAIAPGISGALLTTVAGLTVAIPSVIANIFINSALNRISLQLDIFVEDYLTNLNLLNEEPSQGNRP